MSVRKNYRPSFYDGMVDRLIKRIGENDICWYSRETAFLALCTIDRVAADMEKEAKGRSMEGTTSGCYSVSEEG